MRISRWSEPMFVFVCQLVEVIRETDANETSGEDGLALPGSLVGEYQSWSQISHSPKGCITYLSSLGITITPSCVH